MAENTKADGLNSNNRHPPSSYDAQYPYNQKYVSRSGHEVEFDDTPGHTRIRWAHGKSGAYMEISDNGKRVDMTTGKRVEYNKQGVTATTDGNHDHKIGGSQRHNVSGDSHSEVAGDHSSSVGGNQSSIVGGDATHAVNGDYSHGVTGHAMYKFAQGAQIKFDCKPGSSQGGRGDGSNPQATVTALVDNDINVATATNMNLSASNQITITAGQQIVLQVGQSSITILPDQINIDSPFVSISKKTWIGQEQKGGKDGPLIDTVGGPAEQAWAKV